jgi:curli biogenesis system outer membrane secretion channel CsgG
MKKFITLSLLGAALLAPGLLRAQDAPTKLRIAVLPFTEKSEGSGWHTGKVGTATEDWFIDELVNKGKFRVMERAQLSGILNEQSFQMSGAGDQQTAVKAGKMLGVPVVVFGNIDFSEKQSEAHGYVPGGFGGPLGGFHGSSRTRTSEGNLTCRVISVSTGEIIYSHQETITDSSSNISIMGIGGGSDWDETKARKVFQPAITKIVNDMVLKLDTMKDSIGEVEGKLVKILSKDQIYINLGKEDGIKEGDTYEIYDSNAITDPDSGQELGRDEKKMGMGMIEKISGPHLASLHVTSGGGFKVGNVVKKKK